jgi:CBS domain-containing protein
VAGVHLSDLLGHPILASDGQRVGKLSDVIVALPEQGSYPRVTGLVAKVGGRDLYVGIAMLSALAASEIRLRTARIDVRPFERRDGEVLLRADVLGHRLLDVALVRLVRAYDVELEETEGAWRLVRVDTASRRRLFGLIPPGPVAGPHEARDWSEFEALIGHSGSVRARNPLARLRRLRPAQIADLVEEADRRETEEILSAVHGDAELEADVFEELEAERQAEVLKDRTDAEIAEMLTHMRSDDGADLIADLPQSRRLSVLNLLPSPHQAKVRSLLGFNRATAGGLMNPDFLTLPCATSVAAALEGIHDADSQIPQEVLAAVYLTEGDKLVGSLTLQSLIQADASMSLSQLVEPEGPVHVHPDADLTEVAIRMADYNLTIMPVVDDDGRMLGVVTVDDVLEVTIPEEWRRREEGAATSDRPSLDLAVPARAEEQP